MDLEKEGRVGFLQAVLYGVPDKDKDGEREGGAVEVQDHGVGGKKVMKVQSEAFEVVAK